jgi:hypothetical protein
MLKQADDNARSHILSQVGQEHRPHGPGSFVSPLYSGCMWGPCTVVLNLISSTLGKLTQGGINLRSLFVVKNVNKFIKNDEPTKMRVLQSFSSLSSRS